MLHLIGLLLIYCLASFNVVSCESSICCFPTHSLFKKINLSFLLLHVWYFLDTDQFCLVCISAMPVWLVIIILYWFLCVILSAFLLTERSLTTAACNIMANPRRHFGYFVLIVVLSTVDLSCNFNRWVLSKSASNSHHFWLHHVQYVLKLLRSNFCY